MQGTKWTSEVRESLVSLFKQTDKQTNKMQMLSVSIEGFSKGQEIWGRGTPY